MRCINCQAENPQAARFCNECGKPLARRCDRCGTLNPPAAKFCSECGASLTEPARADGFAGTGGAAATPIRIVHPDATVSAADGERKTVTALFADIKGSTELMEDLDPEEARALVDPALKLMIEAARHYDGYIVQSTGDGIFALFGAPIAHEDHPQRALYAALRMQEGIRQYAARLRADGRAPIEIRIGVNTGEVVVRSIKTGDRSTEYTPIGHTTNLASRLQTLAPTGAIVLSSATARLVAGYFELKSMGPVKVRGVSEPVVIYEATGLGPLRTRLEASALRGLSKFVGRREELEKIARARELATAGHGQVVAAVGEAGVGKSRLFHEFKAAARSGSTVLEGLAVSHGRNSPYLPVIGLLVDYFGIVPADNARQRRERVTGKVLTLDRELESTLPYIFALLGIQEGNDLLAQMDAQIKRQRTLAAINWILLRESRNQPLVLVFEDLHWIDSATQALVDLMVETISTERVLMLLNYRPEYRHQWDGRSYYSELRLEPFGNDIAGEMLSSLLNDAPSSNGLVQVKHLIAQRTAGNPLFIEEMVRALFEQEILVRNGTVKLARPVDQVKIPATVEGILAARIDRLPLADKEFLQTLAVIGREFPRTLAREAADLPENRIEQMLSDLQAADFIFEEPAVPDTLYSFKHALTQEVAYNSVLSERRKALHERIAGRIEALFAARLDDHLPELAYHYARGGNPLKAIEYLGRAADQSARRTEYADAIDHLEASLRTIETLPEGPQRDRLEIKVRSTIGRYLIPLKGPAADEVRAAFERARELCQKLGDTEDLFWIAYGLQFFHMLRLELATARELGMQQLTIAERVGDPAMRMSAYVALGQLMFTMGEFSFAEELCERGLSLPGDVPNFPLSDVGHPHTMILSLSASALSVLGYPVRALERGREAIAVAQPSGAHSLALAINSVGQTRLRLGDAGGALEIARSLADLAAEHGFSMWSAQADAMRGEALIELGRTNEGLEALQQGAVAYESTGAVAGIWRLNAAIAYAKLGLAAEGLAMIARMRHFVDDAGLGVVAAETCRVNAELMLLKGGGDGEAESLLRKAIDTAQRQHAKLYELRATVALARLLESTGRHGEARAVLTAIYHWFSEGFDLPDLREARELLERLTSTSA
ncbi:MAG TPA: adenylate/guanylate cyclase domain-containing protein [Candidatus Binataceae bacterium]|nr:adenylate/guanylate cyclase domain-containing protein [Candidatus Binataceae bacterium]